MITLLIENRTVKTSSYRLAFAYVRQAFAYGKPVAIIIAGQIVEITCCQDFIDLVDLAKI